MRIIHSFDMTVFVASLLLLSGVLAQSATCPADCSTCPTNGAYSVSGNMYYCTDLKQCPCNLPGSGCPITCDECPGRGDFEKNDMGGGVEMTFCAQMVNSSACSCLTPDLAPPKQQGFVPGWGGIHVVQYQKKNPDVSDQRPDGAYHLDIQIFDSNVFANDGKQRTPALIGAAYGVVAFGGQPIKVNNTTPWPLQITSRKGAVDVDPLEFVFDTEFWNTDQQPQCNLGRATNYGYENGKRNGDCGFKIPIPAT